MKQVELIREIVIQQLNSVRARISLLPEFESEAVAALGGIPFTEPERLAAIVDIVMEQLGAKAPAPAQARFSKTTRAVTKIVGKTNKRSKDDASSAA